MTTPYSQLTHDQLLSAITERDEQLRVALLIDEQDYDLLGCSWKPDQDGYLRRSVRFGKRVKREYLQRIIGSRIAGRELVRGELVDHVNHDILDNRRINLRITNHKGNARNRAFGYGKSRHLGVSLHKGVKWQSQIRRDGTCEYLGLFKTEDEAAVAYNKAAEKYGYLSRNTIPALLEGSKGEV